jgi:hypothetical protein
MWREAFEMTIHNLEGTYTSSATVLPNNPNLSYQHLCTLKGLWIIFISGDFAIEGWIVDVTRPDFTNDYPSTGVTIDTGYGTVTGPVMGGDIIAAPLH